MKRVRIATALAGAGLLLGLAAPASGTELRFRQYALAEYDNGKGTRISIHAVTEVTLPVISWASLATGCVYLTTPAIDDGGCGQMLLVMDPVTLSVASVTGEVASIDGQTIRVVANWVGGTNIQILPHLNSPRLDLRWSRNATARMTVTRGAGSLRPKSLTRRINGETTDAGLWQYKTTDPL